MRLPGGERAIIPDGKIERYCLDPAHTVGGHKAVVFASALGLTLRHADLLRAALLEAARSEPAVFLYRDRYGDRYRVDFPMRHQERQRTVRSGWTVRQPGGPPYLTTAFVLPSSHG